MKEIIICLLSGCLSIVGIFIGSYLNNRNKNLEITRKRFEIYKPLYFNVYRYQKFDCTKREILSIYNRINKNMNDFLLLDSKTRNYILKLGGKNKKYNIDTWNEENYREKSIKLGNIINKEFVKIESDLGYPVSPAKNQLTNFTFATSFFSMYIIIASFTNHNVTVSLDFVIFFAIVFLISIILFIRNFHYFGNY